MRKGFKRAIAIISATVLSASMVSMTVAANAERTNKNCGNTYKVCINSNCYTVKNIDLRTVLESLGFYFKQNNTNNNANNNTNNGDTPQTSTAVKPNVSNTTSTTKPNTNTNTNIEQNGYVVSEYEKRVVELVNEIRVQNGFSKLTLNTKLSRVARIKSQEMKDKNYFSHTSPTYGSPFDMIKSFGITYRSAGENIAMGYRTPEAVVEGWMNSEGHRANILNASYKEIGVGYVSSGNYWTQQFIG